MSESQAIGVRLDKQLLHQIESFCKEERLDRSTAMRVLLGEGYANYVKRRAAEDYMAGKTTISKAAERAGLTIWEMEQFLVGRGFKSQYSIDDLMEEFNTIQGNRKKSSTRTIE